MKNLLVCFFVVVLNFACVNSSINSVSNSWQGQKETFNFERMLLVITDSEHDFFEWNEDNYNHAILGRFNNLAGGTNRNLIGNSIQRYLPNTKLIPADRLFRTQDLVSLADFEMGIESTEFDAVLLVHTRELWSESVFMQDQMQLIPSSSYQVFVLDKQDFNKLFATQMRVNATNFNSFENLFDRFGRDLATNLGRRGFVKSS